MQLLNLKQYFKILSIFRIASGLVKRKKEPRNLFLTKDTLGQCFSTFLVNGTLWELKKNLVAPLPDKNNNLYHPIVVQH